MKTLLLIQSSLNGENGQSSRLARQFARRWRIRHPDGRVILRDLDADPLPHLDAERFGAFFKDDADRTTRERAGVAVSDELIAELRAADEVAIGLPMYNFTVPSTFKAWMDHIARAGVTFRYTENGPQGLLADKPVYVFAARGGQYAGTDADTQTGLVKNFLGLLGLRDVRFTYAEGLALGEEAKDMALEAAASEIERLAA